MIRYAEIAVNVLTSITLSLSRVSRTLSIFNLMTSMSSPGSGLEPTYSKSIAMYMWRISSL